MSRPHNCVLSSIAALLLLAPQLHGQTKDDFIRGVKRAWQLRQEKFKSFLVEWNQDETTPKGARPPKADGKPYPPTDVTNSVAYRFAGDGDKLAFTKKGVMYDPQRIVRDFIRNEVEATFDGKERCLVFRGKVQGAHPSASIIDGGMFDDSDWNLRPIAWSFRPACAGFKDLDIDNWADTERSETIDGVRCRVLERGPKGHGTNHRTYVAENGDHRVMRRDWLSGKVAIAQCTLKYKSTQWADVADAWTLTIRFDGGTIQTIASCAVTRLQINKSVDSSVFERKLTPGTTVEHKRTGAMAIVRKDGSLRPVSPAELKAGKSWDELMELDPDPDAKQIPDQK